MPTVDVFNVKGEIVGQMVLSDAVFGIEVNKHVLHLAVLKQLAGQRLGTHDTKNRAEVRGGGRKPWKQKGTGRARAGSRRSPIWVGGGIAFGPTPRKYNFDLPRKVRRLALKSALTSKLQAGDVIVVDTLEFAAPKTKLMVEFLGKLQLVKKPLLVLGEVNENVEKSCRNIPGVATLGAVGLNVYDILNAGKVVLTKDAVLKVEEVLI
ncbi:MAG: 50S ribosomal protein L4 [Firmicutes bacterium]|nr:50S ribosomal protein L4 [Bacillota bacterium]MBT9151965.1 50S ribosomal protein L4 [Bacillota bacterium]MBT9157476.1 50S ribosomal protein L4 [Bacillota bacterium]